MKLEAELQKIPPTKHPLGCFCSYYSVAKSCIHISAGLEILAFPCNQFGSQEPGNNEQIMEFACTRFKAEFPIFDKVSISKNAILYLKYVSI